MHGHWALLRLARVTGDARFSDAALGELTPDRIAAEAARLRGEPAFEMPYGRAWLLRLAIEHALVTGTDALAGTWSYALTNAASNEAADRNEDIVGFPIGSTSLSGSLRAQRNGNGTGRMYTLGYQGRDRAGNIASCTTQVAVPHQPTQQ